MIRRRYRKKGYSRRKKFSMRKSKRIRNYGSSRGGTRL